MNAARLADVIKELIDTYLDCGAEAPGKPELDRASVDTFADAGVVTNNEGIVVTLADASQKRRRPGSFRNQASFVFAGVTYRHPARVARGGFEPPTFGL